MAIKVIRICDDCGEEYPQIIYEDEKEFVCPVDFTCSDCILKQAKQ